MKQSELSPKSEIESAHKYSDNSQPVHPNGYLAHMRGFQLPQKSDSG
jgi:hypothetical protein